MADEPSVKELMKRFGEILGPRPSAPEPRSLSGEFGELLPLLGQLGETQQRIDIEGQKELTQWLNQYQWNFYRQNFDEMIWRQGQTEEKLDFAKRFNAYRWFNDWGERANFLARQANPILDRALLKTYGLLGQVGQRSELSQRLDEQALGMLGTGGPTTRFTETLDRMAQQELELGGRLTPEEERMAQQSARGAYAARGQAMANPAALAEVLQRDSMARARLRERQGIAAGRESAALGRLQYGQAFAGGREAAEEQKLAQERQFGLSSTQLLDAIDANWRMLGMSSPAVNLPAMSLGFTQPQAPPSVGGIMGGGLNYGSDLFNTNLNMAASNYNSYQNNLASLYGAQLQANAQVAAAQAQAGAMGGGGAIGGSLLGAGGAVIGGALAAF
jgi:hypothetical protein